MSIICVGEKNEELKQKKIAKLLKKTTEGKIGKIERKISKTNMRTCSWCKLLIIKQKQIWWIKDLAKRIQKERENLMENEETSTEEQGALWERKERKSTGSNAAWLPRTPRTALRFFCCFFTFLS